MRSEPLGPQHGLGKARWPRLHVLRHRIYNRGYVETRFEWDPAKAELNQRLHGVLFEAATEVFLDPFIVTQEDIDNEGE